MFQCFASLTPGEAHRLEASVPLRGVPTFCQRIYHNGISAPVGAYRTVLSCCPGLEIEFGSPGRQAMGRLLVRLRGMYTGDGSVAERVLSRTVLPAGARVALFVL